MSSEMKGSSFIEGRSRPREPDLNEADATAVSLKLVQLQKQSV